MARRIGVDLGGTKILIALAEENGNIAQSIKIPTRAGRGPEVILKDLFAGFADYFSISLEKMEGIGFCMAGYYDRQEGTIRGSPNLPGWENYPVMQQLQRFSNLPVVVENDANAAAWGEFVYGAGQGKKNLLLVTLGTGIGGALIVDGKLAHGARGFAGEIGHIPILPREGPLCGCGNRGCLETLASGRAVEREGRGLLKRGIPTLLQEMVDETTLRAIDVFEAARQGDQRSREIIDQAAFYLGQGLAAAVNMFNPEIVIIGGGMAGVGELFFAPLRRYFSQMALGPSAQTVSLVGAKLGEAAGVQGILALLNDFLPARKEKLC
ncbi:MAG TPA: ROK family glucokinase [Firmicutes bacterium]|jgi:glucokinase|nr:ROK family glucokinase [Bacillota bacterium]